MFEPSKEMGIFMAHAMYEELEKIAKASAAGISLGMMDNRLALLEALPHGGFVEGLFNPAVRERKKQLKAAKKELQGQKVMATRVAKEEVQSGVRPEDAVGAKAVQHIQKQEARLAGLMAGPGSGKVTLELPKRGPSAARPPARKDTPGLYGRVRNTVGNVGIGAGLLGGGVLAYNKATDPGMPSY